MNLIFFDDLSIRINLYPITLTRPISKIRIGIFTIANKWKYKLNSDYSFITEEYLSGKFPLTISDPNIIINGSIIPDQKLVAAVLAMIPGQVLMRGKTIIAQCADRNTLLKLSKNEKVEYLEYKNPIKQVINLWDIIKFNGDEIRSDFEYLKSSGKSETLDDKHTIVYNPENVFIRKGAKIKAAVLNAEDGPIFIGAGAEVMEGSVIRGPFALCNGATVTMNSKMRPNTTVGPFSKVGGEVSNSVIFGNSNKAHDGFLGNSVIGEWCNIGADTNNSNLKNNYSTIKLWNYAKKDFVETGETFLGLFMGDHSKCGINTMFNSGTVIGVNVNIFGAEFPHKFIPSFTWGLNDRYNLEKAFDTVEKVMDRRNLKLSLEEKALLKSIYEM